MKRVLRLIITAVMLIACSTCFATDYNLWVGGVRVTSSNASNVTGTGISGSVTYDPSSNTLTLSDASIQPSAYTEGIKSLIPGLKINLVGTNRINHTSMAECIKSDHADLTIQGSGSLTASSINNYGIRVIDGNMSIINGAQVVASGGFWAGTLTHYPSVEGSEGYTLSVNNADLTANASGNEYYGTLGGFSSVSLTNTYLTSPVGIAYNSTAHCYKTNNGTGNRVTQQIVIERVNHSLWVADHKLEGSDNYTFTGTGISGSVTYDPSSNTLTLSDASIQTSGSSKQGIKSLIPGLKINLVGTNSIEASSAECIKSEHADLTIQGSGSLTAQSDYSACIVVDNAALDITGATLTASSTQNYGIRVIDGNMNIINGAQVVASGGYRSGALTHYPSVEGSEGHTLSVNNADLTANASPSTNYGTLGGFSSVSLTGASITSPVGIAYNSTNRCYKTDNGTGSMVTQQIVIKAQKVDLWVNGIQVDGINANDVLGDGTVNYNMSTNTLTLNGASLSSYNTEALRNEINGLTINVVGTNTVQSSLASALVSTGDLIIAGSGSLHVTGKTNGIEAGGNLTLQGGCSVSSVSDGSGEYSAVNGQPNKTLTINHSGLTAQSRYSSRGAIGGFQNVSIIDSRIDSPQYALTWDTTDHCFKYLNSNNEMVCYRGYIIIDYHSYNLQVKGIRVTSGNASDILGDGTVSYDPITNTLTLNGATIQNTTNGIINQIDNLKIKLIGDNTISSSDIGIEIRQGGIHTTIMGPGTLTTYSNYGIFCSTSWSDYTLTITDNAKLVLNGNSVGVGLATSNLEVDCAELWAKGSNGSVICSNLNMEGTYISEPTGAVFLEDEGVVEFEGSYAYLVKGTYVKIVPNPYNLIVAGTRVNAANAADVLGDGSVSYDAYNRVLTLNGATLINTTTSDPDGIRNEGIDELTIELIGQNTITAGDDGINMDGYSTLITGWGSLYIDSRFGIYGGVESFTALTVADGCSVVINGSQVGISIPDGLLTVRNATLKSTGDIYGSIYCENFTMEGCTISPAGTTWDPSSHYFIDEHGETMHEQIDISPITYNLWVQNRQVNNGNAFDVLGDGHVTYDAEENVLTLNGAYIHNTEDGIRTQIDNLKIRLIGDNTIRSIDDGIEILSGANQTTIVGPGTLTINSNYGIYCSPSNYYTLTITDDAHVVLNGSSTGVEMPISTLEVDRAELWAKGNLNKSVNCKNLIMELTSITEPIGAVFSSSAMGVVESEGSSTCVKGTYVKITPEGYGLWIAGYEVNSANCSNFTYHVEGGHVSYDYDEQRLLLNNATLHYNYMGDPVIFSDHLSYLAIECTGDNYIVGNDGEGCIAMILEGVSDENRLSIEGPGTLSTEVDIRLEGFWEMWLSQCTLTIGGEGSLYTPDSEHNGINLYLDGSTLNAYTISGMGEQPTISGGRIVAPQGAHYGDQDESGDIIMTEGQLATNVVIASEIDLWVAGVKVNTTNANHITGQGITGNVSYDFATHTLTLENAYIETDYDGIRYAENSSFFYINLVGENTILSEGDAGIYSTMTIYLMGDGSLLTRGKDGIYSAGHLYFQGNCSVEAMGTGDEGAGIHGVSNRILTVYDGVNLKANTNAESNLSSIDGFNYLTLHDVEIIQPSGGYYNNATHHLLDANGQLYTGLVEISHVVFDLWICNQRVTSSNADDLSAIEGVTGTVNYNRVTNTLTLDNASLTSDYNDISSSIEGLTIMLIGDNELHSEGADCISINDVNTTITGSGNLSLNADQYAIIVSGTSDKEFTLSGGCTVTVLSADDGFYAEGASLHIDRSTFDVTSPTLITADNLIFDCVGISTPAGAVFNAAQHRIEDAQGNPVSGHCVIEPVHYDLWVAGTQVSILNADDVLGDGTVSYDIISKVLTLNSANIIFTVDEENHMPDGIRNEGIDNLKIELIGQNTITAGDKGILINYPTEITGSGSLEIDGTYGIYGYSNLTLSNGCRVTTTASAVGVYVQGLTVDCSQLMTTGAMGSLTCFELNLVSVNLRPTNAEWNEVNGQVEVNGSIVTSQVVIEPFRYDLFVRGRQVTSANASDVLGDGTTVYFADLQMLMLNNADISFNGSVIESWIDGLNIQLVGENRIECLGFEEDGISLYRNATISGTGSLSIVADYGIYGYNYYANPNLNIEGGCTISIDAEHEGIYLGEESLTIDGSNLLLEGGDEGLLICRNLLLNHCEIVSPSSAHMGYSSDMAYGLVDSNNELITGSARIEANNVFNGTEDVAWSNVNNWSLGQLPTADEKVYIDGECLVDMNARVDEVIIESNGQLRLDLGSVLTANGVSAPATWQFNVPRGSQFIGLSPDIEGYFSTITVGWRDDPVTGWDLISSPIVDDYDIASSSFNAGWGDFDLYRYNETNHQNEEWENYKSNPQFSAFEPGRGYLYANQNSLLRDFTGVFNFAPVVCHLTYTSPQNGYPLDGYNLIGNPFTHDIYKGSGAAIDNLNLASGYYTLNSDGTWEAQSDDTPIAAGQAIMVRTEATIDLTIYNTTVQPVRRDDGLSDLIIVMEGQGYSDRVIISQGEGRGLAKLPHMNAEAPMFYVEQESEAFAIANMKAGQTMTLCLKVNVTGDYTLSLKDVENFTGNTIQLTDTLTGQQCDLSQGTYSFKASPDDSVDRFVLIVK